MICSDARELISPFLDGELVQDERNALEEHMAGCPACRQELHVSRRVADALRELGTKEISAPADFSTTLMSRLQNEKAASGIARKRVWQVAASAAAALLIAALVKFSGQVPVNQIAQLPLQEQTGSSQRDIPPSDYATSDVQGTVENTKTVSSTDNSFTGSGNQEPNENKPPSDTSKPTYSAQLTSSQDCIIVSTFLKIKVSDSQEAEETVRQIASNNGASMKSLGQQTSAGNICLVDTITVDSSNAQELLDSLLGLGSIVSRQEQRADLTERYRQFSAQLITLRNQRAETRDPAQVEQLDKQIAQTEKQLRSWDEQSSSQNIVIWLNQQ